jgi:hypothetical protein
MIRQPREGRMVKISVLKPTAPVGTDSPPREEQRFLWYAKPGVPEVDPVDLVFEVKCASALNN